ncbi:MAG: hypothetical protein ACUVXI_09165 [bacterium]
MSATSIINVKTLEVKPVEREKMDALRDIIAQENPADWIIVHESFFLNIDENRDREEQLRYKVSKIEQRWDGYYCENAGSSERFLKVHPQNLGPELKGIISDVLEDYSHRYPSHRSPRRIKLRHDITLIIGDSLRYVEVALAQ